MSRAIALGEQNVALVACPPSPELPIVPVPAKAEMVFCVMVGTAVVGVKLGRAVDGLYV